MEMTAGGIEIGAGWNILQLFKDGISVKLGGLVSGENYSDSEFFVESRVGYGTLIFQNAAGADYLFKGSFCDSGVT